MAINPSNLALNTLIDKNSATDRKLVYSATNGVAQIDQVSIKNVGAGAVDVHLFILSDDTITGSVTELDVISVGAGLSEPALILIGHKVPSGGSVQAYASSITDAYITISGAEIRN